jgi:hypothetical protein
MPLKRSEERPFEHIADGDDSVFRMSAISHVGAGDWTGMEAAESHTIGIQLWPLVSLALLSLLSLAKPPLLNHAVVGELYDDE